jgi:hypothetical protein
MAIFAIRSAQNNVNEDGKHNPNNNAATHKTTARSTARTAPEPVIQFDDDMAHFVTHLDADPLAESQLKMHLVEYDPSYDAHMVREIPDDNDEEYTYIHAPGLC